ncbi:hypothetical protein [Massilia yuzhufengensis]|uniref:Uncharacterized protein n=1 Tax=Massilia yuzhufengensis TaxID=1164594 RepID=A0A1I1HFY2_9BURK|nr:hypothetical protein [Massilia yuzhufengensis]SFC22492.1 hypothetical protein SAMN05216204_104233 [Massilia yuzhufengensis]
MRPLQLLLPLSLALLVSSAGAQNLPYPPADTAPLSTVQVSGLARDMRIEPRQAKRIAGAYEMSNGWYLRVNTAVRHIDAIIDDQQPLRLVQVARNKFASGDGNVTMEFGRGTQRDEMEMSYVPGGAFAQRVVMTSTLAQR